jgi:hypothetical protein
MGAPVQDERIVLLQLGSGCDGQTIQRDITRKEGFLFPFEWHWRTSTGLF